MAEEIILKEPTNEYITETQLGLLMNKVVSSLQPRIEQIVKDTVKAAIEEVNQRNDGKLSELKGELQGIVDTKLSQHSEDERKARQAAIESMQSQIQTIGGETQKRLGEVNQAVESAKQTVNEAKQAVSDINQTVGLLGEKINGWTTAIGASNKLWEDNRRDIEAHNKDLDTIRIDVNLLGENEIKRDEQLKQINYAIYGGTGDGPKSLFAAVAEMAQKVDLRFSEMDRRYTAQETISTTSLELTRTVANRMDVFEQSEQLKKERRAKQLSDAKAAFKEAAKTPYFWIAVFLLFLTFVSIFAPATLPSIIEFIYRMTNNP